METAYKKIADPEGGQAGAALFGVLGLFVFLIFAFSGARKPFTSDEHWFVIAAYDYAVSGSLSAEALIHSPLYNLVNGFLLSLFKDSAPLKFFGAFLGAGSMGLLWLLGRACGAGGTRSAVAVLLLGVSPLFIQGSLLLDTDNTLVVFFLLAALLALFRERWGLLSAAVLLLLWSKLTAALPLLLVLSGWGAWGMLRGDRRGTTLLLSLSGGILAFFASFYAYSAFNGLPFWKPFYYLYGAVFSKKISSGGGLLQVAQFILWSGPAFCLLWSIAAVRAFCSGKRDLDMLAALLSVVVGAGYFFVGGTPFGFPKFQIPAFVFGCWLVSGLVVDLFSGARQKAVHILCVLAGAAAVWAAGDPIYTLRFVLRETLVAGQAIGPNLYLLSAQAILPFLLAALFWFLLKSGTALKRAGAALVLACLAGFVGMDILQARSYNTIYTYGATGVREAARSASLALKEGGKGFFPVEITAYLRLEGLDLKTVNNSFWSDGTAIKAAAADPGCKILMYGTPFNTREQMRVLTSSETKAAFNAAGWRKTSVGSYELWTRAGGIK